MKYPAMASTPKPSLQLSNTNDSETDAFSSYCLRLCMCRKFLTATLQQHVVSPHAKSYTSNTRCGQLSVEVREQALHVLGIRILHQKIILSSYKDQAFTLWDQRRGRSLSHLIITRLACGAQ